MRQYVIPNFPQLDPVESKTLLNTPWDSLACLYTPRDSFGCPRHS